MRWKVYYDDGSTVSSKGTEPEDVPTRGVLVIAQEDDDVGRIMLSGHDYYVWKGGEWYGIFDQFGLWDYLANPGWKRVLFGRTVPNEQYRAVYEQALEDSFLPPKSAWEGRREQERERPPGVEL